jgi:hypothetical protein
MAMALAATTRDGDSALLPLRLPSMVMTPLPPPPVMMMAPLLLLVLPAMVMAPMLLLFQRTRDGIGAPAATTHDGDSAPTAAAARDVDGVPAAEAATRDGNG